MCLMRIPVPFLLSFIVLAGCTRVHQPGEDVVAGTVMLQAETKALPAGVETFRVALFSASSGVYSGRQGTYCTQTFSHTDDYSDPANPVVYTWLQPCKVNAAGEPLDDTDPGNVTTVDAACHNSSYGLRWSNSSLTGTSTVELVAVAPAVAFEAPPYEGASHAAYLEWNRTDEVYVSDPVAGGFQGIWFNGEYVYNSLASGLSSSLVDHRAKVSVRIQCAEELIPETRVFKVWVTNYITTDRYYLRAIDTEPTGFSRPEDPDDDTVHQYFAIDSDPDNYVYLAGSPDSSADIHLVRGETDWTSDAPVYLQARDYSVALMAGKRPLIVVQLGASPSNPVTVRVPLAQNLDPMLHYVYVLDVKNAYVTVSLAQTDWENSASTADISTPAYLGAVSIDDGGWMDGGGGVAETPDEP